MKVIIDNSLDINQIWITVNCTNLQEIQKREKFYETILSKVLNGSPLILITITPKDYSLGFEYNNSGSKTINDKVVLINNFINYELELIENVVLSEEFRRTLLIIVKAERILSDTELEDILDLLKGKSDSNINNVIYCEDDGDSLCLYRTNFDLEKLISISKELTENVQTNINW
jgi:hypothetical protein